MKKSQSEGNNKLAFGTGGLRGIMGEGPSYMNFETIGRATQGLANIILKEGGEKRGVAIAFDSRNQSPEFSEYAALCLNANGICTYRFETLRPTPELSFAVRYLGCIAGIVITASHNPPEYNGYKVYWEDGAQITFPKDQEIIEEVNAVQTVEMVKTMSRTKACDQGLFQTIGEDIDKAYIAELKKLILNNEAIQEMAKNIRIVYTPLHGSGNIPVQRILKELGFTNLQTVPEQTIADGDFPTVKSPNPEDPKAFTMALSLAEKIDADIILATDPDADRLGVYVKKSSGKYVPLTGNMSGLLLAEYQLSQKKEKGILPQNGALITTIVSSRMADEMALAYGIQKIEVLTGFKYIGEQIRLFEERKKAGLPQAYEYLFGYEESYGCLAGTYARDKDAVVAAMLMCEAAAYYKQQGWTLWEQVERVYIKYGYYKEDLLSVTLNGAEGLQKISNIMEKLREDSPMQIGSLHVLAIRDYKKNERIEIKSGESKSTGLPKSDVLYYELEDNGWCCIRPSGTEPKIKFYMGVKGQSHKEAEEMIERIQETIQKKYLRGNEV